MKEVKGNVDIFTQIPWLELDKSIELSRSSRSKKAAIIPRYLKK